MMIENFRHHPGVHCESTAIRNLLAFKGLSLSEPMVFGLGSGLSFIYWDMKKMRFPFVGGRIKQDELAKNLSKNIGFRLIVEETKSAEKALKNLRADLSANLPVGLKLDMYYLDYFDRKVHFAAHNIVACGFDDDYVFVADTDFKDIKKVGIDNMKKARSSKAMFSSDNLAFKLDDVPESERIDFPLAIKNAIRKTAEQMLNPPIKNIGVPGIRMFSKEILKWDKRSDNISDDFGFHYIMFEKGGSGGAGYRNMYRDFLIESFSHVRDKNIENACAIYSEVSPQWTRISERIRDAPKSGNLDEELDEISKMIAMQADKEEEAMRHLEKLS